ncbi:inorganic phosphate transport protein [Nosema bombycis CQ1]|uniref:Inorganic phosphate transport protein n=1 Tax=Nosema bombycis (strain CQ1 / CVCC 102059) TaxID=578461 RepID=R0MLD4_NOSB1|nr:inorganic phosphate transport protein [Nosema bombycis CQ1]|eukprot:EOB15050.1 inorganic phosphate transport protein [Nosema bombycis CQ1]
MSIALSTVDQAINFGLSILTMQISKKPYFQEPKILWIPRGTYVTANLFLCIIFLFLRSRINKVNDQRKLRVKKDGSLFQDNDVEEEVEVPFSEYDMKELTKLIRSSAFQIVIVAVLHVKWGVIQPLIVQSTGPFRSLFLNPLCLAYIWNKPILRPFELNTLFQKTEAPKPAEATTPEKKRKKEE